MHHIVTALTHRVTTEFQSLTQLFQKWSVENENSNGAALLGLKYPVSPVVSPFAWIALDREFKSPLWFTLFDL